MKKIIHIFLISISLLIFSCQNSTNIGYQILPEEDLLKTQITDTLSIEIHTISTDSIRTSGVSELLLGEYTDPVFGYTNASFVTQFAMAQSVNFSRTDIVDSIVVSLPYNQGYNNLYGNPNAVQNVEVYKIEAVLDDTKTYYNTENPDQYANELIGTKSFIPNTADSILNITLSNTFGYYLLTADESYFATSEDFRSLFKGLYFTSKSQNDDGAIMKFDINQDFVITLYFHDEAGNSAEYKITANNSANIRFNMIEHDYSTANFAGPVDDESLPQDSVAYIQSGGGFIARIKIPYLKELQKSESIVINRAELVINSAAESSSFESEYPAVERMFIANYISGDSALLIPDYTASSSYTGESYVDETYKFDIAAYIQNILDGTTESNGLNLYPASEGNDVSRTVITTGNNSNPTKLIITYTKL